MVTYSLVLRIQPDESADMTRCIPSTALVYFEQQCGIDLLTNFSTSPLGKKIESIDFAAVAKEIGAAEETIAAINDFTMAVKSIQNDPLIKELFEKRIALALLPPLDNAPFSQEKGALFRENLVIIGEPQHPAKVLEMLTSTFQGSEGEVALTSVQYGRHRIMRIVRNGQTFSLVILESFFIMGQNERQLRQCIDTFDGEQPSFSDNAEFLSLKTSFSAADSLLVLPLKNAGEYLPALFADYDLPDIPFLTQKSSSMQEIIGISYGAKRHRSTIREKILIRYDPKEVVSDSIRDQLATRAIKPSRLSLTTPNPMFYMWSNSFNLNRFLTSAYNVAKEGLSDIDFITRLEVIAGKDFEHLAMFGKEITIVAEPGSESSPLPFPLAIIFIPVSDQDVLKAMLKELVDTYNIPIKMGEHGSAEYTYWSQSPQDGLFPLCGFFGDLFFLGNSETLLHKVIDTHSRGLSLLDIDSVKKIDPGLAEENNSVIYSNNVQLAEILKIVLNTLGTLLAIEDREFAMKARVVINKVLTPLLDGAKMYDTSVTRSYCTPEMIVVDVITNISNHP